METTKHGWTVVDRDAGVLFKEYSFTKNGTANSFVARMADGKLMIVSPPTRVSKEEIDDLAEFGDVGAVVAPNGFHHLGIAEWRTHAPAARFFAAPEAQRRIKKKNNGAGAFEPIHLLAEAAGDGVHVGEVKNTKCGETWVCAETASGNVWFVSDVLANIAALPKNFIVKMMFKMTKSAPGYRVFGLALKFIVKDKKATLRDLAEAMGQRPPSVVICGHGAPLADPDIAETTQRLIATAF